MGLAAVMKSVEGATGPFLDRLYGSFRTGGLHGIHLQESPVWMNMEKYDHRRHDRLNRRPASATAEWRERESKGKQARMFIQNQE